MPKSISQFYLQDSRGIVGNNLMFWGKDGGYTSDISSARVFSEDDAFGQNNCRSTKCAPVLLPNVAPQARGLVGGERARTCINGVTLAVGCIA